MQDDVAAAGSGGGVSGASGSGEATPSGASGARENSAGRSGEMTPPAAGRSETPRAGRSGSEAGRSAAGAAAGGASGSAAGSMAGAAGATPPAADGCDRALLASTVQDYFTALAAHDSARLPLASMPKFTENGKTVQLGEGLWKTAGMLKFKRSALDTQTCSSVTESVIAEDGKDIVVGLRLKLAAGKITEIETIVVRSGDYASNPMSLIGTASDDWETVVPADQRASRDELLLFVTRYFSQFPRGGCNFASECQRFENGFTPGACSLGLSCSMTTDMSRPVMPTRLTVLDVEAGIAVGFTMFQNRYTDFHMFKVRGGKVVGVHAVLANASGPGW